MFEITTEKLLSLGFELNEYPDGKFYVITAHIEEPRFYAVTRALGYADYETEYQGDEVIVQCREDLTDWQIVFGTLVGSIEQDELEQILANLDELENHDWFEDEAEDENAGLFSDDEEELLLSDDDDDDGWND